jgi:hypothetical protein
MNVITFCRNIFIGLKRKQVIKKSQTVEIKVILIFLLFEGRIQIRTNNYGSWTLKNVRIRNIERKTASLITMLAM